MKPLISLMRSWMWLAQVAGLGGIYFLFARLGSFTATAQLNVSAVWPASGLAIAAVWWGGYRLAPAIWLGTFVFLRLSGAPALASAGVAFGNLMECALAVYLVRRYVRGPRLFNRVRDVFAFFFLSGVVAIVPSVALGLASLCWGGLMRWADFGALWLHGWAAHLTGVLIVAPALLTWTWPEKFGWMARHWAEAAIVLLVLTAMCTPIFTEDLGPLDVGFPAAFPLFPIILWAGLRLGQRATTSALLLTSVFAAWGTLQGTGPFAKAGALSLLMLHSFIVALALTGLVIVAGVAERHDSEEALRENEARKSAIFESAFDAILSLDHTGTVREWNSAAERMFNYHRSHAVGRSLDDLLVPADRHEQYLPGLADYLMTGAGSIIGRSLEMMLRRADGKEIPVELAITPVSASEPPMYTVIIHDLTQRKQTESALRQSEERFRLLIEGVKDYAIYMLDPEGRVATWSPGAERVKGYRAEEIIGRTFRVFFTEEDLKLGVPEQVLKNASEQGAALDEGWRVRKDGSRFWAHGSVTAVRDEAGKLCGFSKVAHDTTEQKRAEQALQTREALLRSVIEAAPSGMVIVNRAGRITMINTQIEELFGYPREEILGQPVEVMVPERHRAEHWSLREAFLASPETRPMGKGRDLFARRKDGSEFAVEIGLNPIEMPEGWSVLASVVDITDRKRTERALRKSETHYRTRAEELDTEVRERTAQLQASLDSVEELLYTIAHDLRAPNRAMQGFAHLLQLEYRDRLDDKARDYLSRISVSAVRNDELIRDLLEFGRVSHESVPLAPTDLRLAVEAVLQALREEIGQRQANVHLGPEWPRVQANESVLKQVLTNLLSNALKSVPIDRRPDMSISAMLEHGKAMVRVIDNGVGIPLEQTDRVFKPFMRLRNSIEAPGTGMGLAIVKKAVERMNGKVGVESTPGKGSCFWFELWTV